MLGICSSMCMPMLCEYGQHVEDKNEKSSQIHSLFLDDHYWDLVAPDLISISQRRDLLTHCQQEHSI